MCLFRPDVSLNGSERSGIGRERIEVEKRLKVEKTEFVRKDKTEQVRLTK